MKTENEIRLMLADYPDSLPSDEELMIAVFMGLQPLIVNEHHKIVGWYRDDPKTWFSFPEYKTWNSLMPVWLKAMQEYTEEFGLLTSTFEMSSIGISIKAKHSSAFKFGWPCFGKITIQDVYRSIVEYIRWFNSQNS